VTSGAANKSMRIIGCAKRQRKREIRLIESPVNWSG